jgi:hypothetical protein
MHEHVADPFDDAVPFDPNVVTIAIAPVPIDPDPFGTNGYGLLEHDSPRRRRCGLGGGHRLRLLHYDDRLPLDLLSRAGLGLDDYIGRWVDRLTLLPLSRVAVVRDIDLIRCLGPVAVGSVVVGGSRNGGERRDRQYAHRCEPNEVVHGSSLICTPARPYRHPPVAWRARPARQGVQKVLGFRRF